jgi:predicted RNA-binding protein (virulence factor B family)
MRIMTSYDAEKNDLRNGDAISIKISEKHDSGFIVIINDLYQGFLFSNDIDEPLHVGDERQGYVKNIRPDDRIDVSLKPVGVTAIKNDKVLILEKLAQASDKFLPVNSKTSAEEVKNIFNLSKKAFKKAIGGLYKERKISITDDGIKLK